MCISRLPNAYPMLRCTGARMSNQIRDMCKKSPGFSVLHKTRKSQNLTTFTNMLLSRAGLAQRQIIRPCMVRGFKTIPQPPGNIVGTVNDAYVPPPPSKAHGSWHWTSERIVAASLLPLVATSFTAGASTIVDTTLSTFLLYHCHTGFQACITDYIPARVYGSLHNYAMYLLTFGTGVAGFGIYTLEKKEEGGVAGIVSKLFKA